MHRNFPIYFIVLLALNLFGMDEHKKSYCKELHNAVKENNYAAVKRALKKTTINCRDEMGRTALHVLAEKGESEQIFKLLNKHGASALVKSRDGSTPLTLAVASQNLSAITMLFRYFDRIKINAQNNAGQTALHVAVLTGNTKIIKRLLLVGARQNIKDKNNMRARKLAEIIKAYEVSEMLANENQWAEISLRD